MPWRQIGAKPYLKPMLISYRLDIKQLRWVKHITKSHIFNTENRIEIVIYGWTKNSVEENELMREKPVEQ